MTEIKNYRPEGRWQDGLREWCEYIPPTNRGTIIQVGVFGGDATLIFSEYFKYVIDVDTWLGWDVYEHYIKNMAAHNVNNFTHFRAASLDAAKMFEMNRRYFGSEYSAVYIDANHKAPHPANDIKAYLPLLPDWGYIGGHDYNDENPDVMAAVDAEFGRPDKTFQDGSWIVFKEGTHQRL